MELPKPYTMVLAYSNVEGLLKRNSDEDPLLKNSPQTGG